MNFNFSRRTSDESAVHLPECGSIIKSNCIHFHAMTRKLKSQPPLSEEIMNHFQKFGNVVKFHRNCMNSSGFVIFESKQDVHSALLTSEHVVKSCKLKLHPAKIDLQIPRYEFVCVMNY